ncbi:S8/S53 family peptidase [Streptomyces parvulus]|nr:S8/S53 family peptidase [Streptomyces parvulus]
MLESELGEKLFEAVDRDGWPEILSLSAGTSNGRTDGLLGVHAFMEELRDQRTLLVAAAGNNGSATPFWPAAYAELPGWERSVLSVGALRADGEFGACFSNHGGWVKVYAPASASPAPSPASDHPCPTSTSTPPTTPAGTASATPAPAGTPGTTASSANPARRRPSRTR